MASNTDTDGSRTNRFNGYKRDNGLTLRIVLCFAILAVLYLVFLSVLSYLGVGFIPITLIAVGMLFAQFYFSDKIVLWSSGAKVVSKEQYPELHEMIEDLANKANLPKPKVAVVNTNIPNAFATGKGHKSSLVAVTTGLLDRLDKDELAGVIGHELTHIKSRDLLVITLVSLFSTIAWYLMQYGMFSRGYFYGGSRNNNSSGIIVVLAVAAVTWIVSFLITRAISRYREYAADRGSAQITGKPIELANALTKISKDIKEAPQQNIQRLQSLNAFFIIPALSANSLANLFSTHPPLEKRIQKLEDMEKSTIP